MEIPLARISPAGSVRLEGLGVTGPLDEQSDCLVILLGLWETCLPAVVIGRAMLECRCQDEMLCAARSE